MFAEVGEGKERGVMNVESVRRFGKSLVSGKFKHLPKILTLAPAGILGIVFVSLLFPVFNPLLFLTTGAKQSSAACVPAPGDSCGDYTSSLTLATSGRLDFAVTASESGRISSGVLRARVNTDSPVGYNLTIEASAMNNGTAGNLTNAENANTGKSDALVPITTSPGNPATIAQPATFSASNCNSWGFAIPNAQVGTVPTGWNESYVAQSQLPTTDSAHNTYRFAAVPTTSTMVKNAITGSSGEEVTDFFFAACAGGAGGELSQGAYQGNITITATTNSVPAPTITSIAASTDFGSGDGGNSNLDAMKGTGPITGNQLVTITGTGFGSPSSPYLTEVYIGGTEANDWTDGYPCTELTVISSTQATCRTAGTNNPDTVVAPSDGQVMQTMTAEQCAAMNVGDIVSMVDARDNKEYKIKKMPDEKCWMYENLGYTGGGNGMYSDTVDTLIETTSGSTWDTTNTTRNFVNNSSPGVTVDSGEHCTNTETNTLSVAYFPQTT